MLLVAAFIWGSAFVAQSEGMNYVGPFTYVFFRSVTGTLVLMLTVILFRIINSRRKNFTPPDIRASIKGGLCCGAVMFTATSFQQFGIGRTTAGKAGFVTTLYIIIVPVIGFFMKKKTPLRIWICALAAIAGFWLLCIKQDFTVSSGDLLVLVCAFFFSLHIMTVDHFSEKNIDAVLMSCVQFAVAAVLALPSMLIFEEPHMSSVVSAAVPILYAGVLSSGVAFTLQIFAQKDTDPTVATMIMSLESVFAAVTGWLILNESMSVKETAGCVLVFAAVIAAQLPAKEKTPVK